MSGMIAVVAGGGGPFTDTFSITTGPIPSTALYGYSDGSSGTSGGAAGSLSGATTLQGGKRIVEISSITAGLNIDRLRIKGVTVDPKQGWLISVTANGATQTGANATYAWDSGNNCATWQWTPAEWGFGTSTYNNNKIYHNVP